MIFFSIDLPEMLKFPGMHLRTMDLFFKTFQKMKYSLDLLLRTSSVFFKNLTVKSAAKKNLSNTLLYH